MALGVKDKLGDIILEAEGGSKEEAAAALAQLSKMSRFNASGPTSSIESPDRKMHTPSTAAKLCAIIYTFFEFGLRVSEPS